ncbi:MAG: response regulator [Ignavibacteriales bacterium]|nr:response regulator [Ignavibacteriales bacterium]
MPELTPRDDIRKVVSEILKRVDQLLKVGDVDQGMREIIRAKEIDPKNIYIHAYEERINFLKQEHDRHKHEEQTRKQAEEAARKRDEEQRKKVEEEWKKQEEERRKRQVEEERRRKEKEEEEKKRIEEDIRKEQEAYKLREKQKEAEQQTPEPARTSLPAEGANVEAFNTYKQALKEVWSDGAATDDEEAILKRLGAVLNISPTDHATLEKEVKLETYFSAFKRAWATGSITPEAASSLADLRKKFQVSPEEHEQIEAKLLWELRAGREQAKLVIIDDDQKFLGVVTETLQDAGFQVRAFTSSDNAFKYLKEETPDIIISDINLETSTMGGFTFYEKVRELEHLAEVPFIFLSGLTDEVLIRTGKELGVDDYLTKPFSDETLIATIRGKLKRFRQLKKAQQKK